MNLNYIENMIKTFEHNFPKSKEEINRLTVKIVSIFESKLEEIKPIINVMQKENIYFCHPDLNGVKTTHGVILGKNYSNENEIFIFNGKQPIIHRVDSYQNEIIENSLSFEHFFRECNLNFALKGIEYVKTCLPKLQEEINRAIEKKTVFISEHKS